MAAYIIGRIDVTNPAGYSEYTRRTPEVIAKFGGRFLARGGKSATLEGPTETRRVVILEFPSLERAEAFFHSTEYAEVKKFRAGVAVAEFLMVDGTTA